MVSSMRALILLLPACIVSPPEDETGLEPDVDVDGDADSDTDSDADSDTDTGGQPWNADAISFDFSGAILGGELVDGAIVSGKRHEASFSLSLMSVQAPGFRNCNVRYLVAGAPGSVDAESFGKDYWRSWSFADVDVEELTGECDSLISVFRNEVADFGSLEVLLRSSDIQIGIEDMDALDSSTVGEWSENWSFGIWKEDVPYLAAGGLSMLPFGSAYEMNVFQAYAIDAATMEVESIGDDLVPLELQGAPDVPDGFYTSSPMYIIGTQF
jgi:hypothetical protein